MNDLYQMMRRQSDWQKARAKLAWPEKIKQAEILRETCLKLRSTNVAQRPGDRAYS